MRRQFTRREIVSEGGMLAAAATLAAATPLRGQAIENEITDMTAVQLRAAIASRTVSCREVMTAYLARIDAANPTFNAIVSRKDPKVVMAQAEAADAQLARGGPLGPLHGFPQAPKDATATTDLPTTLGSELMKDYIAAEDSIIVARARKAGAIVLGKTNMPDMGVGSHTYNKLFGTTFNAWNKALTAGGSSGGAGVALAQRMLPVADGSDMMGSIRNPAGWNNVVGLRPTIGRVPTGPSNEVYGAPIATEGPMARTVADTALLLSVEAGYDSRMPLSLDGDPARFAEPLDRDMKGTRIGYLGDFDGYLPMERGVMDLCTASLKHFEAVGCTVESVRPGFDMARLWDAWLVLRSLAVGKAFEPMIRQITRPQVLWEYEFYKTLTLDKIHQATLVRSAYYESLRKLFERHDFLLLPTAQMFPFDAKLDWPKEIDGKPMDTYHRWMEVVVPGSMAGLPIAAVPAGFGPGRRAIGIQIMGPMKADLAVLQVAHTYEKASQFSKLRPY